LLYLEIAIKTDILSLKEDVYFYIGFCNDNMGNYSKAIEAYKQAIRINPNDAYTYYFLGSAYYSLSLYKESIEAYKQGTRIEPPNDTIVYYNIGLACDSLSLYKDAIEAYKQAISINPDYVKPHFFLGISYHLIGDKSSALNEYKILRNLDINFANDLFGMIY
jgi:tetratricopeptide (TPR) repeat protein